MEQHSERGEQAVENPEQDGHLQVRWFPHQATGTFRGQAENGDILTAQVTVVEVVADFFPQSRKLSRFTLRLSMPPETYELLEGWGWLGLKPGQLDTQGHALYEELPVELEVTLMPRWLESPDLPALDPEHPGPALMELLRLLFEDDQLALVSDPPNGRVSAILQHTPHRTLELIAEMDVLADEAEAEALRGPVEPEEPRGLILVEPRSAAHFGLKPILRGDLQEVRVLQTFGQSRRVELVVRFTPDAWQRIESEGIFDLSTASRGPSLGEQFLPDQPVELTLLLAPARFERYLTQDGATPASIIEHLVQALADPEVRSPLQQARAYVYLAALQKVPDRSFQTGFRNKHLTS